MAYTLTYTLNSAGDSYTLSGYSGDKPTGELVIPNSYDSKPVTSIGNAAFGGCSGLTSITIPDSVTSIGNFAFDNCSGLTRITIPDSVTSIGNGAFSGCSSLQYNIYDNAKYLGNSNNPYVVLIKATDTSIASCEINEKTKVISSHAFYNHSGLASITIPDSVMSISRSAFEKCTGLTSITIPNSVTSIGDYAFSDCTGLTSITIHDGLTSIDNSAFRFCSGLTSVTIPDSVTSIANWAFDNCTSLTKINMLPTTPPTIQRNSFATAVQRICVPAKCRKDYITATNWNTYADKITEFPILDLSSLLMYNNKVKARIDALLDASTAMITDTSTGSLSKTIKPNVFYEFTDVGITDITITFGTPKAGALNEYMFQFTASASTVLNMPEGVKWINGEAPVLLAGKTYQISVVNNLAVSGEF